MAKCREVSMLISKALDTQLPWRARLAVRLHLLICGACRNFQTQSRLLRRFAAGYQLRLGARSGKNFSNKL